MKERYRVTGMTCSACSAHVEKAVGKLPGMEKVSVNLLTETMDVEYDGKTLTGERIIKAVEQAGYGGFPMEKHAGKAGGDDRVSTAGQTMLTRGEEENRSMKIRLFVSLAFLLPLMYVAMFHMYREWFGIPVPAFVHNAFHGPENAMQYALTQFLLLLPILYLNRKFFAVGFKTLFHLSPNMDSLIAVGASASTGYGIFAMYRIAWGLGHGDLQLVSDYAGQLYFETAGMILTLITVGKYLESRSKGKTGAAIAALMDLSPRTAIVERNGEELEIPTEQLRNGDVYLVKPGSSIPADGTVLEGYSSVDESAITGESIPVEKSVGDTVISASVNKAGFLRCRADKVGEDTTLAAIIRLVEEAGASKAPIARLADKVAGVFVPVVMGIALVTLIVWLLLGAGAEFALSSAIAVLVISCPCALGLATPVAIMVGTGVGARKGILIRSGEALQLAKETDTVVLDKTGTITDGRLRVNAVYGYGGCPANTVLVLAAALEKKSEHPLAEAIVSHALELGLAIPETGDFKAVFGRGVEGTLAEDLRVVTGEDGATAVLGSVPETGAGIIGCGTKILIGNEAFLAENGIVPDKMQEEALVQIADEGATPLLAAADGSLLGIISVVDRVKSGSEPAIRELQKMKINVVMLTGDNRRTAEAVRQQLGIGEVLAEVLPQDKEAKVRELQAKGHKVTMVGDGINDAPALTSADVGMAIGAGTDVAMESADIVLMKSDLRDAVNAITLSRAVIRNIKQNLFWAFFYNAIGIPLAAGVWYPAFGIRMNPMFGAAAMSLSSLFVVGNALRLRGFRGPFEEVRGETCHTEQSACGECGNSTETQEKTYFTNNNIEERKNTMKKTMTIEGMMCGHCTGRVQKALEAVAGVKSVEMSLENKTAVVELEAEVADSVLTGAVTEAGYEVTGIC